MSKFGGVAQACADQRGSSYNAASGRNEERDYHEIVVQYGTYVWSMTGEDTAAAAALNGRVMLKRGNLLSSGTKRDERVSTFCIEQMIGCSRKDRAGPGENYPGSSSVLLSHSQGSGNEQDSGYKMQVLWIIRPKILPCHVPTEVGYR